MLESAWRVHVEPAWGRASVAGIDAGVGEAWVAAMWAQGAGATPLLRAYGVLSGILAMAVKSRRPAANPAEGIDNLPRKTARRHVYLTADDVARLAGETGHHRAGPRFGLYRHPVGEAVALRVRDVKFLRRRLSVSENAVQLGVDHAVGPTKGRKARSVPVPGFVLEAH
jgi:integrase